MWQVAALAALGACGEVVSDRAEQVAPDAGAAVEAIDAAVDAAPACDPTPAVISGVTASTAMGSSAGTRLDALTDRSGLVLDVHDCNDATTWLAASGVQGSVTFDLGAIYDLTQVRIWNNGQITGQRGARTVNFRTSLDNKAVFALPGSPTLLTRATTCSVAPQTFSANRTRARFVIIEISSSFGDTRAGLAEVELAGARVCD